jgi:hypothetical protein
MDTFPKQNSYEKGRLTIMRDRELKVRQVGDNVIIEKPLSTSDMIERFLQKAQRNRRKGKPPKSKRLRKKVLSPEAIERRRTKESKRERKARKDLSSIGLCSACGKLPPVEKGKTCQDCRDRQRERNFRYWAKKIIEQDIPIEFFV